MNKYFFIVSIILCSTNLFAQPDCRILVKYIGSVKSESIKIYQLGLPTTPFLDSFINKTEERAFAIYKLKDSIITQTIASHMSSEFCTTFENIINNVFKKPKGGYLIKVFEMISKGDGDLKGIRQQEVTIPLDAIKFTTATVAGKKEIIIDLGEIKL